MYTVHATRKLLDRVKAPIDEPNANPSTALGNWYATALTWRPQVALFVNEQTLLPILLPLAPARTLLDRFPAELRLVLDRLGVDPRFVDAEIAVMQDARYAKTTSRSVRGSMNDFAFLADTFRQERGADDLSAISLWLAGIPCGPLRRSEGFPDRELLALVARTLG